MNIDKEDSNGVDIIDIQLIFEINKKKIDQILTHTDGLGWACQDAHMNVLRWRLNSLGTTRRCRTSTIHHECYYLAPFLSKGTIALRARKKRKGADNFEREGHFFSSQGKLLKRA